MPNIPPRGLPARHAHLWKNPDLVHARVTQQWKSADFVWGAKGGLWQLLWARTAGSPGSATATYSPGQVKVDWVPTVPAVADLYRVYRSDGSLAGSVNAPALTFTDLDPKPLNGAYAVIGVLGGVESTVSTVTNSLDLLLAAATFTATATGSGGASPTVKLDWTPHALGRPDSWNVYRVNAGEPGLLTNVAGTVLTFTDASPPAGTPAEYLIRSVLTGIEGGQHSTIENVAAKPPVSVVLAAINPPATGQLSADQIQLSWTAPTGSVASYEVEHSTDGTTWTASTDDATPVVFVSAVPLYARVRSRADGGQSSWVQQGPVSPHPDSAPGVPTSVSLAATTSPLSNLRLTWAAGAGAASYEVQTYVSSWVAHSDDTTPSDWSTSVQGYMRVRSVAPGGYSAYVQDGPVAPINDITGPGASTITSFEPESSFGRMVARGNWASASDVKTGQLFFQLAGGAWSLVYNGTVTPGAAFGVHVGTGGAGQATGVLARTYDAAGNMNSADATAYYTLASSATTYVSPSGDESGTYRGSAWRNDNTRSTQELATGWTSSGHNIGCYFYGTAIASAIGAKTVISGAIEYYRENEGGLSAAIQPLFWTHALTARSGAPSPNAHGVAEGSRLGSGVARTGTTGGSFSLPSAFISALQSGSARGLCMYRGYQGSGDPDSYYGLMGIGGNTGGSPSKVNGRLTFTHLG